MYTKLIKAEKTIQNHHRLQATASNFVLRREFSEVYYPASDPYFAEDNFFIPRVILIIPLTIFSSRARGVGNDEKEVFRARGQRRMTKKKNNDEKQFFRAK
jgi:hypothetical protein